MEVVRVSAAWCSSCILTYSSWTELQAKYPNNSYKELDYDADSREINELKIGEVLPVHIIYDDYGRECKRYVGELSKRELIKEIGKYLVK